MKLIVINSSKYLLKCVLLYSIFLSSCAENVKVVYDNSYNSTFSIEDYNNWEPNVPNNWEVLNEEGEGVLHLKVKGTFGEIRKPSSYAILTKYDVTDFELTVDAKCLADSIIKGRDLVVIFGYQDSAKFYYCHISNSNHKVHNIIGLVNNKDREPLTDVLSDSTKARLTGYAWHHIKVVRDTEAGSIEVFVNDMTIPIHSITDRTLLHGKVGVGSFDDTGKFKNFEIKFNDFVEN